MKIKLSNEDAELLQKIPFAFDAGKDYSGDEALDLLEAVREAEAYYAQGEDRETVRLYHAYVSLGDRIFDQIPGE